MRAKRQNKPSMARSVVARSVVARSVVTRSAVTRSLLGLSAAAIAVTSLALTSLALMRPALAGPSILFEAKSGTVLYAEDVGQAWHPASLTKLMTAYITFEALKSGALKPEDQLICSEAAFKMAPSKVGLKIGQQISADLALRALVIKSANDMAVMLAEKIGGTEAGFVGMMNATARRLGMKDTTFANPNGLPHPNQITTARDLALLATALMNDYPEHAHLFATPTMTIGKAKLASHNRLLQTFQGADGMKTGFICDSGYNIVATATRDGNRLVAVVLGGTSAAARNVRAAAMLEYGFQNLSWKLSTSNRTLQNVASAPTDNAIPGVIRTQVMNWSCGWRPPKELLAAANAEESVDVGTAGAAKPASTAVTPAPKIVKAAKKKPVKIKTAKAKTAVVPATDASPAETATTTPALVKPKKKAVVAPVVVDPAVAAP